VTTRALAAVAVAGLLAAGCSRVATTSTPSATTGLSTGAGETGTGTTGTGASTAGGAFGSVKGACHGGSPSGSPDQGVTPSSITVGVLTDEEFTKDPTLANAAKVFTSWCNAAGGIDGRQLVADIHQTDIFNVTSATAAACGKDFVLAGGSAALDGLAVSARLKCLLPDYDAQPVMPQATASGLQLQPYNNNFTYSSFAGFYKWVLGKYPDSAQHVGILSGQSVITQVDGQADTDAVKALGGTVAYNQSYPVTGTVNWTPYAEAVKSAGIKGLTFYGVPQDSAAFEQALDNIGYKLDWMNPDTNSYQTSYIQLAGNALSSQNIVVPLPGIYPLEQAKDSAAVSQLVSLFNQYEPGQPITLQAVQAWSMWLLFAKSAESCGSELTRACAYKAAIKQVKWTGGGLTAPVDEADLQKPANCFNVEQATPSGWQPADFGANTGPYLCGGTQIKLPAGFQKPTQLSTVGKSLSDLH
jgi:ABC-type branched-subunit amino acid transport system substrate-binding protein